MVGKIKDFEEIEKDVISIKMNLMLYELVKNFTGFATIVKSEDGYILNLEFPVAPLNTPIKIINDLKQQIMKFKGIK